MFRDCLEQASIESRYTLIFVAIQQAAGQVYKGSGIG
jgi:hypothetical protein